ncbi:hypothetical protein Egran_03197 [Elaphomyces granulatus]|uniref:DNA polymerase delta subunit 3 n=1 Tax=Elaphomyces granulatus TaxID=519963 RepID=A0A232LYB1_9EURO|nr:hypothetical protein Egran_03197 [Elaphomyces granulatus]
MAADYKRFLAENVINEHRIVTYRLLSRALKVHCTLAKQMLYEFYRSENAKRLQSVHATYLITGIQWPMEEPANQTNDSRNGEDEVMQSSPFMSSMPQPDDAEPSVRTTSMILVREEDMPKARATFKSILSIHIYSLQSTVLQDLNVLTDVGREMRVTYGHEDPLEYGKQCGITQNKNVMRRSGSWQPPPRPASRAAQEAPPKLGAVKQGSKREPSLESKKGKEGEPADTRSASQQSTSRSLAKPTGKNVPSKREKSDLFKSFAKAKPRQVKQESNAPAASEEESAKEGEFPLFEFIFDDDDNDEDASEEREDLFLDTGERKNSKNTESRREREEKLKKMMEDDDDEMPDVSTAPDGPQDESPPPPPPEKQAELKEEITSHGGRRRGRRQVMKKKTIKDEEGYLVTIQEPMWESFSEDEPVPPPKKKPAISVPAAKGKKTGQGNIKSFFSKK